MSKLSDSKAKRIESPFAKYNSIGQLTCVICNQVVKSESLWNAHLNSKSHLENKNKLKSKLTKATTTPTSGKTPVEPVQKNVFKRPASSILQEEKQNSTEPKSGSSTDANAKSFLANDESNLDAKKQKLDNLVSKKSSVDAKPVPSIQDKMDTSETDLVVEVKVNPLLEAAASTALPEGFFDDPDMDDKVRGVSRTENLEAEYEEFKKIMQSEEYKSDQIVEKDDVLRDVDRDLEEVDELIGRWSKIEDMHNKREAILAANKKKKAENASSSTKVEENSDSDDSDLDMDSVLNLAMRNKKRY